MFNLQLSVKDLFSYNTVSLMAKLIDNQAVTPTEIELNLEDEVNQVDQAKGLE